MILLDVCIIMMMRIAEQQAYVALRAILMLNALWFISFVMYNCEKHTLYNTKVN